MLLFVLSLQGRWEAEEDQRDSGVEHFTHSSSLLTGDCQGCGKSVRNSCFKRPQSLPPSLSHTLKERLTSNLTLICWIYIPWKWRWLRKFLIGDGMGGSVISDNTTNVCTQYHSAKCYHQSECMNTHIHAYTHALACTHATRCPLSCNAGCLPLRGVSVGNLRWRTPGNTQPKTSVGQQAC